MKSKRSKATDIPMSVKKKVWERDNHRCVVCGNSYNVLNKDLSDISEEDKFKAIKQYISDLDGVTIKDIDNNELLIVKKLIGNDDSIHDVAGELSHHPTTFQKQIDKEYRKELKQKILMQIEETLETSNLKIGKPDVDNRHSNYNITDFDKSIGLVYDGTNMYQATYDVAVLKDGTRIPYNLKNVSKHNSSLDLMAQKKNSDTIMTSSSDEVGSGFTPSSYERSISQNVEKFNNNNETKYSLSEQLEKNLEKTVFNAENERQGMIDLLNSYLEENDITNPTQEDIGLNDRELEEVFGKQINKEYDKAMKDAEKYKFSLSESGKTTDSNGNELSEKQIKFFGKSKAINKNGQLEIVYHTTTDETTQFNTFNPVGTDHYRFGDQVVNYFTNSKNMSGSYANQNYEEVDTKKMTPHGFRHSHVSLLIDIGCDSREVAERIGDTVETVENTYYHMFPKKKKMPVNKLNELKQTEK